MTTISLIKWQKQPKATEVQRFSQQSTCDVIKDIDIDRPVISYDNTSHIKLNYPEDQNNNKEITIVEIFVLTYVLN